MLRFDVVVPRCKHAVPIGHGKIEERRLLNARVAAPLVDETDRAKHRLANLVERDAAVKRRVQLGLSNKQYIQHKNTHLIEKESKDLLRVCVARDHVKELVTQ